MNRRRPLPFAPSRGGVALTVLGLAIFGAAHTTGAGWLVVLASLVAGTVIVGAVWPPMLMRTLAVSASGPTDAVAGRPFTLDMVVQRPHAGVRVSIRNLAQDGFGVDAPETHAVSVTAERRGVLHQLTLRVWCGYPFDLFGRTREVTVDLPHPIFVAPEPIAAHLSVGLIGHPDASGAGGGGIGPGEMVRSLREYVPGDAMRLVHWRVSAASPDLIVKELEPPERPHLVLIVDVDGPDGDQIAGEAAGLIQIARREGIPVTLGTFESTGPVMGEVGSMREAGRRLASAVPGLPPDGPLPPNANVVRLSGRTT